MSIDYKLVCFTCKSEAPSSFACASGFFGYKVLAPDDDMLKWLGHGEAIGHHENCDLRIMHEDADLPWANEARDKEFERES
jgi:hypothetical protein